MSERYDAMYKVRLKPEIAQRLIRYRLANPRSVSIPVLVNYLVHCWLERQIMPEEVREATKAIKQRRRKDANP